MRLNITKVFLQMRHWKKSIILLFLSTIILSGCSNNNQKSYQGYIEGNFTYIASQISGRLLKLDVKRGTKVTKNQPLFNLELKPQSDALFQAQAQLIAAKADLADLQKGQRPSQLAAIEAQQNQVKAKLKLAKVTVNRYRKLYLKRFIQKESLDQAVSNYNDLQAQLTEVSENLTTAKLAARSDEIIAAKAKVLQALAQVKQLQWQYNQKMIRSPVTGIVFDRYFRTGEIVQADQPVLSILESSNIYLVTYIPEQALSQIKLGQTLPFSCDGCQKKLVAKVSFISPDAEFTPPVIYSEKSRAKLVYRVEADLTPAETKTLHPGQPITVNLS